MTLKNEIISCDFCHSDKYSIYEKINEWTIVKCDSCGFYYTNPRPTLESLPYYYTEDYFKDERHMSQFYNEDGSLKLDSINYTNRIMDAESYINHRGKLLELGAARGGFLNELKQRGWQVSGVEISQDACNQAKLLYHLDLFCGTLHQYHTKENFDVISMYQTLEHVPDPKYVIERSYELLNKNGIIVIEIPNLNCFEMKYSKERRRLSFDLPRHHQHFTPDFLSRELKKAKFEIMDIRRNEDIWIESLLAKRSNTPQPSSNFSPSASKKTVETGQRKELPLLKYPTGFKQTILKTINKILPGWRFTIIGKKK